MDTLNRLRVAWLVPTAWFYWQPPLSEFTKIFPNTKVFTGLFPGFTHKRLEDTLNIQVVGDRKVISMTKSSTGYGANFTYLSPNIVGHLLRFKPQVVFSSSFGVWTICAILLKPIGKWRVIIAYEGSSPSVDCQNSALRLSLRRAMVKAADALITNSKAGKNYLTTTLNAREDKVFHQPYEVPDIQSLTANTENTSIDTSPQDLILNQLQKPIFLFVGSIVPRKGLHLLLAACTILQKQGHHDYTLLIVGDGPQRQELEAFCQEHNLQGCVKWAGQIDYGLMGTYFRQADVFVLPSLEDTWGMVVLEAMALGKPVLCSTGVGASEMVIAGENGYLFEPHQPEQLAEVMYRFIERPEISVAMGNKSQQVLTQHTPEIAAQFLAQITSFACNQALQDSNP